jgi:hypothetical protein
MLQEPKLSTVAAGQLAAWEELARDWPVYADEPCMRCVSCHVAVYRTHDDTDTAYVYAPEETLALTVAHLRQAHTDLDPDR